HKILIIENAPWQMTMHIHFFISVMPANGTLMLRVRQGSHAKITVAVHYLYICQGAHLIKCFQNAL
ncbi:MAG: hypothetical protein IJE08_12005, partial [Clostridia bacterium]|nr:hypothetical protein [Clostridia bacterium]